MTDRYEGLFAPDDVIEMTDRLNGVEREMLSRRSPIAVQLRARLPYGLVALAREEGLLQEVIFETFRMFLNAIATEEEDGTLDRVDCENFRQWLNERRLSLPHEARDGVDHLIAGWLDQQ